MEDGKDIARYKQSFSIRAFTECYHTRFIVRLIVFACICDRHTIDYDYALYHTRIFIPHGVWYIPYAYTHDGITMHTRMIRMIVYYTRMVHMRHHWCYCI